MTYTRILYTVTDGVAVITFNDPPANTYSYEMMREIDHAVLEARMDAAVHVIVLTGQGEKFFCAGANIGMLKDADPTFKYYFCLHANETLARLEQTPKLVIAALNGHPWAAGSRWRWPPTSASPGRAAARSACPRWRWACCPAPAAHSGWRAWSARLARSS